MESILNIASAFSNNPSLANGLGSIINTITENVDAHEVSDLVENSKMMNNLVDEARYLVYFYNTTTLVTTGGLALGIAFIILALALYYFYYVTDSNSGRSNSRSDDFFGGPDYSSSYSFLNIVEELERAFVLYNIETDEEGCRRRVVCEAHLPDASTQNKSAAFTFVDIMSRVDQTAMKQMDASTSSSLHGLKAAALSGEHSHSCRQYHPTCPNRDLKSLPQL